MRTLAIETGIEPEYEEALIEASRNQGWKILLAQNIPFSTMFARTGKEGIAGDLIQKQDLENPDTWFHGSIQAGKAAQKGTAWKVHAPWHALRCSSYYPKLQERLFQKKWSFTTVERVFLDKDMLFSSEAVCDETLFFRPDGNDKLFTGGCISLPEFEQGYKLMTFYEPPPEAPVVVAQPQRILSEARFLIVGGKLITGSYYKTGGQSLRLRASSDLMKTAEDMLKFCLAQGFDPAPSWVLDLAESSEGNWGIMEVGATSCCGLYKCDLELFVRALDRVL